MKRILFIVYIYFILCIFTACGKNDVLVRGGASPDKSDKDVTDAADSDIAVEEETVVLDEQDYPAAGSEVDTEVSFQEEDKQKELCAVYVCGAVVNPDVYYLEASLLKKDALDAAGGFSEGACEEYINLAEHIKDGERIYFPYESEVDESGLMLADIVMREENTSSNEYADTGYADAVTSANDKGEQAAYNSAYSPDGKLNINRAGRDELMALPGIGEAKADAILSYRSTYGNFKAIEDIKNITGIKDGVYNKIKDYITVD